MSLFEARVKSQLEPIGIQFSGDGDLAIRVKRPRFYKRAALQGSLGFGESYADGDWECDHLDKIVAHILRNSVGIGALPHLFLYLRSALFNMQTVVRAKRVAMQHYDITTNVFEWMLDPYLQYTCGYWPGANTLELAQTQKMDLVIKKLGLEAGDHLLDIGCGWGGLARYASERYGIKTYGLSISHSQLEYAAQLCEGLDCEFRYGDYRHLEEIYPQQFDAISIIGVTEHIGYKNYRSLYQVMRDRLKEDGLVLQHCITDMKSKKHTEPFTDKYIFPGGVVPSVAQLSEAMDSSFVLEDLHNFGADYDLTLMAWHRNLSSVKSKIINQPGLDERFYRVWEYYLLSCAALFRVRKAQLMQWVLSPKGVEDGYSRIS